MIFYVIGYSGSIRRKRQGFVCWIRKGTSKKYKWSSPRQPSQSIFKTIAILESGTARIRISSGWSQIQIPRWCQYIQSIQYSTWSRYTYHLISLDQIMFNYYHYGMLYFLFSMALLFYFCFCFAKSTLVKKDQHLIKLKGNIKTQCLKTSLKSPKSSKCLFFKMAK